MSTSRLARILCAAAAGLAATFAAGVFVGRGTAPQPPVVSPAGPQADSTPARAAIPTVPVAPLSPAALFDFKSPDAGEALDAALADWFTAPGRRELALSLLVDPMAGPFDGSRPPLTRVIVEARGVPGGYRPKVPGVPAVVENMLDRPPPKAGELSISVDRFAVLSDGGVVIEFTAGNHGYKCREGVYTVRKGPSGWRAEFGGE